MINRRNVAPVIFQGFDQAKEIARLKERLELLSQRPSEKLLARGMAKFIELDLLKYGNWPTEWNIQRAFGAVSTCNAIESFIDNRIRAIRPAVGAMLDLLAEGELVVDIGQPNGRPEVIFWAATKDPS